MTDDFSVFFKKKMFFLQSFMIINSLLLLCMATAIVAFQNMGDPTLREKYILMSGFVYFVSVVLIGLPFLFKSMVYLPICSILTHSKDLKPMLKQMYGHIWNVAKNNQIDTEDIDKSFEDYDSLKEPVLKYNAIVLDKELTDWLYRNKDKIDKASYSKLSEQKNVVHQHLVKFVDSALIFYDNYGKYVETGKYKAPNIPPMFFDEADITAFREFKKKG